MRGVRALLLAGGRPGLEQFAGLPLALLDVLGRNVLLRTIDRLHAAGVEQISVLCDARPSAPRPSQQLCSFHSVDAGVFWSEALRHVRRLSRQSECVLIIRLGAWAEVDFAAMVAQHRREGSILTQASSPFAGVLEVFVISSGSVAEAAALIRGELRDPRIAPAVYESFGYVNPLLEPADIRRLTLDAFAGEAAIVPAGREVRPGVWVGDHARIHREARLLAPAFVGAFSRVRRGAVVTRGSALEHHSELDCAAIADNSNLLPYSRVAAGLDIEEAVLGSRQVHSLLHHITINVEDPHLIGTTQESLSLRAYSGLQWLLSCVPVALREMVSGNLPKEKPQIETIGLPRPTLGETSLAPVESESKPYRGMVGARRYGDE